MTVRPFKVHKVLQRLVDGAPVDVVATELRTSIDVVEAIAGEWGGLNRSRLEVAVDQIETAHRRGSPYPEVDVPLASEYAAASALITPAQPAVPPRPAQAAASPRPAPAERAPSPGGVSASGTSSEVADRATPPAAGTSHAARQQLVDARLSDITPDPDNPRDDVGDVAESAASMSSTGLLQPIVARRRTSDGRLVVVAGLAAKIGRHQTHVSARLALLALPAEEQEQLRAGQINLGDAVRHARIAAGTARAKGYTGAPHLGIEHTLSDRARARCRRLDHKSKGRNSVGGVACGECWESVIRADERQHLHAHSGRAGQCALCSGTYGAS